MNTTAPTPTVKLHPSWMAVVGDVFDTPAMKNLRAFLAEQKAQGKVVYPRGDHIFNALNTTPFEAVRVVILGQDPYHGPGQAHGLSFSVPDGVALPPSLANIYRELERDLGIPPSRGGNLTPWAQQGVLLLNSVLTVEQGQAASHQGKGWEGFTDRLIHALNTRRTGLVFLLWGSYAQAKGKFIDTTRHCVLTSPHPSPLSAHRGFLGNGHFSKANTYLQAQGQPPIDWNLAHFLAKTA
jgi:uracil-DNA glycosylase